MNILRTECSMIVMLLALSGFGKEIIRYTPGSLENRIGNHFQAENLGVTLSRESFELQDNRSGLQIRDSESLNFNTSSSLCITFKLDKLSADSGKVADNEFMDMFFFKNRQLIFGRYGNRLYANFHTGKKWLPFQLSDRTHPIRVSKWHFAVLTISVRNIPSSDEVWTDVKMYLDGALVLNKRLTGIVPASGNNPVKIGCCEFGRIWNIQGKIGLVSVFDHVLSHEEIKSMTLKQKEVVPDFTIQEELPGDVQQTIAGLKHQAAGKSSAWRAYASALTNLAFQSRRNPNWKTAVRELQKTNTVPDNLKIGSLNLLQLRGADTILTAASDSDDRFAGIVSFYDAKNNREFLLPDNPFFALNLGRKVYPGLDKSFIGKLVVPPDKHGRFVLSYTSSGTEIRMPVKFANDRLEYQVQIKSDKPVAEIWYPLLHLAPLNGKKEYLLIPKMSGIANLSPRERNIRYSAVYPSGFSSMQLGAYYDEAGGLYFSPEDPEAYPKNTSFEAGQNRIRISYRMQFPEVKEYSAPGKAALERINGSWYDAGLTYRKFLSAAPWWIPDIPRTDTQRWFQNITLGFSTRDDSPEKLKKMRDYIGLPFCLYWYAWHGSHDRDFPHFASTPDIYKKNEAIRKSGIRTVVYVNGRLFELKDCRDEDRYFSKIGKKLAVRTEKGEMRLENYGVPFAVMCPAAEGWSKILEKLCIRLAAQHFDGIYMDQVGASRPLPCFSSEHGHLPGDMNHWYKSGYCKMLKKIRQKMTARGSTAILSTEDNAEPYVKFFDGVLPWRWINDEQVPLFTLCYSGRVQFHGLPYKFGADNESKYAKSAFQFVFGQHIGWFYPNFLFFDPDFALYVKHLAHARYALLDFFNAGMLERPLVFTRKPPAKKLFWFPKLGTQYVTTPDVLSACWKYHDIMAVMLVNHTNAEKSIAFKVQERKNVLKFSSVQPEEKIKCSGKSCLELTLAPRDITVLLMSDGPVSNQEPIRNAFNKMKLFSRMEK